MRIASVVPPWLRPSPLPVPDPEDRPSNFVPEPGPRGVPIGIVPPKKV